MVRFLITERAVSRSSGNGSSCPVPAIRRHHKDRRRGWEAVIRSPAIVWQRCASYSHYSGLGTVRQATNLETFIFVGSNIP